MHVRGDMGFITSSVVDSGDRWFCGGKMYFRQLDQLTINISIAESIEDDDWGTFMEDTLALSRKLGIATRVSLLWCVRAYPNARQRMAASAFLVRHRLEKMGRLAVLTDSTVMRGAMTAASWIMPKLQMSAFSSVDVAAAFHWLHEVGSFDEARAMSAWRDAQTQLGMTSGASNHPKAGQ